MPELPEVETTVYGIRPHIIFQTIASVIIRHFKLRFPIPNNINEILSGQRVESVERRGKYILITTCQGTAILHLGMSGSIRIINEKVAPKKHDHIDIIFHNGKILRYTDPRRFGAFLWTSEHPELHPLLQHLGPEPLLEGFDGDYLWKRSRGKKVAVKSFIMDSKVVVGVGNIYAAESLFRAGILPIVAAGKISRARYALLAEAIRHILAMAIQQGGTTLKDFVNSEGQKGYFSVKLNVYGRGHLPCLTCNTTLTEIRLGQRSTVYCKTCQR